MGNLKGTRLIEQELPQIGDDQELPQIDDEFDADEPVGFTDEDVAADVAEMGKAQRDAVERSRKRGTAPKAGRQGHRTSEARAARSEHRDHDFVYRPINSLDAPPPRPGMEQRWIRILLGDKQDIRNWAKQSRYRWSPRKLETVEPAFNPPTQQMDGLGDVIVVGDLMLCERPIAIGRARRKYMEQRHQTQLAATKRHVKKAEQAGHKISVVDKEDLPVTVGIGRRVKAQADDE